MILFTYVGVGEEQKMAAVSSITRRRDDISQKSTREQTFTSEKI